MHISKNICFENSCSINKNKNINLLDLSSNIDYYTTSPSNTYNVTNLRQNQNLFCNNEKPFLETNKISQDAQ